MISWRESINYDPIGDCCRANRNPEYWKKQRDRCQTAAAPNQGEPTGPRADSDLIVALGLRVRNQEYRKRQLELLRKIYRTEET